MSKDYDLIVIGGGSAGLTAAIGGSLIGAKVLLVDKHKIGGDCTHYGCVPSKTLIKASKIARSFQNREHYGLKTNKKVNVEFDIQTALKKKSLRKTWCHKSEFLLCRSFGCGTTW